MRRDAPDSRCPGWCRCAGMRRTDGRSALAGISQLQTSWSALAQKRRWPSAPSRRPVPIARRLQGGHDLQLRNIAKPMVAAPACPVLEVNDIVADLTPEEFHKIPRNVGPAQLSEGAIVPPKVLLMARSGAHMAAGGGDMTETQPGNPLLEPWTGPFEAPPFARARARRISGPAFDAALDEARAEIAAVAANPEPATFENTIEALERSGRRLSRVSSVFFNLASADTNDEIQAIEREIAPRLARHRNDIFLDQALYQSRRRPAGATRTARPRRRAGAGAGALSRPVLARRRRPWRRGQGAARRHQRAPGDPRGRVRTERARRRKILAPRSWRRPRISKACPTGSSPSAARAAADRGLPGKHVITLARSSVEPFLQFSARRDLREKAFAAWSARGEHPGPTDNRAIASEIVKLRAERARLLGFDSFAEFRLADTMAKTPEAARALLEVGVDAGARARRRGRVRAAGDRRGGGRQLSASRPGTGATIPKSAASGCSISTRTRSSPTSRSTG